MRKADRQHPVLLVHGGAWAIPAGDAAAHERGVRRALEAGWDVLLRGGPALDAVVSAVTVLEDDETFDAGRGSFLTSDGRVQLDALLMDGGRMKAGGVACVERLRNPIQAARLVLEESPHVYFVGAGAEEFAVRHGMELIENGELVLERERERLAAAKVRERAGLADDTFSGHADDKGPETAVRQGTGNREQGPERQGLGIRDEGLEKQGTGNREQGVERQGLGIRDEGLEKQGTGNREQGVERQGLGIRDEGLERQGPGTEGLGVGEMDSHDTVGAVALDLAGNLAAGTSTGGTLNKAPGRVGDSSLIGCGCYADNLSAAVSLTGWGEPIMKLVLGKWATDRVAAGAAPEMAAREAISYLYNRLGGHGGIILLGPDGRFGLAHNTPAMAWGRASAGGVETGLESGM